MIQVQAQQVFEQSKKQCNGSSQTNHDEQEANKAFTTFVTPSQAQTQADKLKMLQCIINKGTNQQSNVSSHKKGLRVPMGGIRNNRRQPQGHLKSSNYSPDKAENNEQPNKMMTSNIILCVQPNAVQRDKKKIIRIGTQNHTLEAEDDDEAYQV